MICAVLTLSVFLRQHVHNIIKNCFRARGLQGFVQNGIAHQHGIGEIGTPLGTSWCKTMLFEQPCDVIQPEMNVNDRGILDRDKFLVSFVRALIAIPAEIYRKCAPAFISDCFGIL